MGHQMLYKEKKKKSITQFHITENKDPNILLHYFPFLTACKHVSYSR